LPLELVRDGELNVKLMSRGRKAVLVKRPSGVRCYGDVCPHMGADLAEADYDPVQGTIRCRWHGYLFSADDGRFVEYPNQAILGSLWAPTVSFRPERTPAYRLTRVPCRVDGETVRLGRESGDGSGDVQESGGGAGGRDDADGCADPDRVGRDADGSERSS
jgi:nitrite reductase/ring-hydroxylating ferredoxin subunit